MVFAFGVLALAGGAPLAANPDPSEAVFSVRVTRAAATSRASAVLLHRADGAKAVTLYFVTTAHLFRHDQGGLLPRAQTIMVEGRPAITLVVDPRDVEVPRGTFSDLALMRVVVPASPLTPRPITFTTPDAGSPFFVGGRDGQGRPVAVQQHVTQRSTMRVLGDRELTGIAACAGAPAVSDAGIFGIVAHCDAGRRPEIALFEVARNWMLQRVPGLAEAQRTLTRFEGFKTPK
jgi:hypothetical protein